MKPNLLKPSRHHEESLPEPSRNVLRQATPHLADLDHRGSARGSALKGRSRGSACTPFLRRRCAHWFRASSRSRARRSPDGRDPRVVPGTDGGPRRRSCGGGSNLFRRSNGLSDNDHGTSSPIRFCLNWLSELGGPFLLLLLNARSHSCWLSEPFCRSGSSLLVLKRCARVRIHSRRFHSSRRSVPAASSSIP